MAMTTQQTYSAPAAKKMKLEHEGSTPSTPQPASTTPVPAAPAYSTAPQWSTQIPIDPQLQQPPPPPMMTYQHYGAYGATHYPQAAYASHPHYSQYQTAQPPATAPAPQAPQANQPISRQATQTNDSEANVDIATLNDALGSAGLDLRAEEETLQRSQDHHMTYRIHEDRSRKQSNGITFDSRIIGNMMREIGTRHKVARIPDDSVSYVALALRMRLQGLLKGMVGAAEHRASAQFDREPSLYDDGTPMWSVIVRRDVKKQLEVLERVDREEEMRVRRERRERADVAAAAQAAQAAGESPSLEGTAPGATGDDSMDASGTSAKKPKKKKDGPGVTARNMSEDVQKRLSNAVATQAAGLGRGKYAWMNAGSAAPAAKTKAATPAAPAAPTAGGTTGPQTPGASQAANASSWAKPYVPASAAKTSSSPVPGDEEKTIVTMRDAMFVIERERGHGAGRGSARGWV